MIRPARPEDADAIWALLEPVFRAGDTYAVDPQIAKDDALHMWLSLPIATYVFELNDQIVGTYYIKTNQQGGGAHVCNCGYIVSPSASGQGIAAQMCTHSQSAARDLGFAAMQFNFVVETNVGAIHLWKKLGFDVVGRLPRAFNHPNEGYVDALVMTKPLLDESL